MHHLEFQQIADELFYEELKMPIEATLFVRWPISRLADILSVQAMYIHHGIPYLGDIHQHLRCRDISLIQDLDFIVRDIRESVRKVARELKQDIIWCRRIKLQPNEEAVIAYLKESAE